MRTDIVIFCLALAVAPFLQAEPTLELVASDQAVSVGDRVTVQVFARGGGEFMWANPEVQVEADGPWAVVDQPKAVAGASPPAWKMTLVPLEVGEVELPEVVVSARPTDGEPIDVAATERPLVTVATVLSGEAPEPAPMRDPLGVSGWAWEWIAPVFAILLPLLAVGLLLWRLRRRAGRELQARQLSPLEELEAALGGLSARVGRDPAEGVCDKVAWALRRYLERRTGEPALEMTSFELRLAARRQGWPDLVRRDVQRAMEVADGVRFGRRLTADEELGGAIAAALEGARKLEEHLRPSVDESAAVGGER